jgi:hypothetical protein
LLLLLLLMIAAQTSCNGWQFGIGSTSYYQIDNATSSLQDADGRLVRDGRFQNLSVDGQDLVALGQPTISVNINIKKK